MPKLTYNCPICNKQLKLKAEHTLGSEKLFEYTCGHMFSKSIEKLSLEDIDFTSVDGSGKQARDYQKTGIQFILESDFNAILGDQMRLGKTPQGLLALKNKYKERTPCLILVRGANIWQWIREYKVWVDPLMNGIFPIVGTQAWIPPGFSTYIISMDTFSRPKMIEKLKKIPFKLIIADEAHSFKNTDSNRSQALVEFVAFLNTGEVKKQILFKCTRCQHSWEEEGKQKFDKRIGPTVLSKSSKCPKCGQYVYQQQQHDSREKWQSNPEAVDKIIKLLELSKDTSTTEHERANAKSKAEEIKVKYNVETPSDEKPCGIILLTGTPILNRAEEYFIPLNLVNPEKFSSLERFRNQWLDQDGRGRWSKVKRYYLDAFKKEIEPYFLRREKEDVYKDLPKINKIYTLIDPDKDTVKDQYNKVLDKLEEKLAQKVNPSYWDTIEDLMALRRLCGMMKVMWTADYLESCALESPSKYAIGIHHESVRDVLYLRLGTDKNCYKLSGEDNSERKDWIMRNWETTDKQFLIINMLAGGVGMDFHYCDNVVVLERQWNSEVEVQFEFRFYNPDLSIKKNPTNIEYVIAKGTLDEWWYDMVEEKRRIVGETMYNHWKIEEDQTSFRDLLERTVSNRI